MDKYLRVLAVLKNMAKDLPDPVENEVTSFVDDISSIRNGMAADYIFEISGSMAFAWIYQDESSEAMWGDLLKYDDNKIVDESYKTYHALINSLVGLKRDLIYELKYNQEDDEDSLDYDEDDEAWDDVVEEIYNSEASDILQSYDEHGVEYNTLIQSTDRGDSGLFVSEINKTAARLEKDGQKMVARIKNSLGYWEDAFEENDAGKKDIIKMLLGA